MSVTIRAPRPGDGAGMARVWLSAAAYYADLDPAHFRVPPAEGESFEGSFGTGGEDELMLVADLDSQLAGWLTARIEYPGPSAARQMTREHGWTRLHIDALMVDQAAWHQGVGTALLTAAEEWGRDRGAQVVRLDTYADSPVSVPFYERHMGYRRRAIVFQKLL
jgi:GNAT superfamily N-acetyltransferase